MTQAIFVDLLNTQLAAAASTTSTTLTLSSSANLPTLESGQFFPLWLQDAATGQVHELVYVTGVSGATLTVERAQEGTTAQNWNIGDLAYSNGSSGTFAPITAVHSPVVSETLPTANKMVVIPGTLTADIALTLPASPVVGQEYTIFGSNAAYTVTVQTDVTSGSPYIGLPDGSTVYSWMIPASASLAGIVCVWDGTNWRARTFGTTVVSDATSSNEAVALGQLEALGIVTNGSTTYSSSTTLTTANQGQIIFYTGSAAGTFTLPASNSLPGYECKMVISNQSGYPLTIVPPSGDNCDLSPNVLQPNQYCCVGNDGGTDWHTFWNTAGSASPFVVANAAASNEAVALGQAFTYLSPTASETVTPTSLTTVVNPQVSSASTITLEPGTVAGQKVLIYSNGNYVITVSSNVTSGAPSFVMPDDSNIYSFDLPVNWGAFIEGVWDGTNWRCVTGGPTVVADATANNQAVALGQVLAVSPAYNQHDFTPASGGTYTISNSFTAPCNGYILAASTINLGNGSQPVSCTNSISINGTKYGTDDTIGPMTNWGAAAVSSGTACTVTSTYTAGSSTSSFSSVSQTVMSIFIPNP